MKYLLLIQLLGVFCSCTLYNCPPIGSAMNNLKCGQCQSFDDPHIATFDGVNYDQHTVDCFQYVTSCPDISGFPIEICGCHDECGEGKQGQQGQQGQQGPTCIHDIIVSFFDSVGTETYNIFIDSSNIGNVAEDTLTSTPLISGNSYTFDSGNGYAFKYTHNGIDTHIMKIYGGSSFPYTFYGYVSYQPGNLDIYLDDAYFNGKTCGLCGKFSQTATNPNIGDDFTGSDGVIYVPAPTVATLGFSPAPTVVNQINDFANTYKCDNDGENQCDTDLAKDCCQNLWDLLIQQQPWENPIISFDDFKSKWLYGCIVDSCSLSNDDIPQPFDFHSDIYQFIKQFYIQSATKTYDEE